MTDKRPYIPLAVRVKVAERQFEAARTREAVAFYLEHVAGKSDAKRLEYLLSNLFGDAPVQLDHDPALILRMRRTKLDGTVVYSPDANSHTHLIYREKADHQQKTTGRKPGAERTATTKGSDIWLKTKFDRLDRKKTKRKKPWPKGRTMPSRPFQKKVKP